MFTLRRIAYHQEGVFFPTENALSAGKRGMGEVCYLQQTCFRRDFQKKIM